MYIIVAEIGMSHTVIPLVSDVSKERKAHFPHGPKILPPTAPTLRSHCGADATAPHIMAIMLVAHPTRLQYR